MARFAIALLAAAFLALAYLGGTKIRWWRTYQAALAWRGFDDWLRATRQMPTFR